MRRGLAILMVAAILWAASFGISAVAKDACCPKDRCACSVANCCIKGKCACPQASCCMDGKCQCDTKAGCKNCKCK
jgi:hypothetical protein